MKGEQKTAGLAHAARWGDLRNHREVVYDA